MKLNPNKLLPNRETTQWVVLANRVGAKIFKRVGKDNVRLIKALEFPAGKLRNRDLAPDKPIRAITRGKGSTTRHSFEKATRGHEIVGDLFAREIANVVDKGRVSEAFDELVLVAEPKFLGVLKKALGADAEAMVARVVRKDLGKLTQAKVRDWLREL